MGTFLSGDEPLAFWVGADAAACPPGSPRISARINTIEARRNCADWVCVCMTFLLVNGEICLFCMNFPGVLFISNFACLIK